MHVILLLFQYASPKSSMRQVISILIHHFFFFLPLRLFPSKGVSFFPFSIFVEKGGQISLSCFSLTLTSNLIRERDVRSQIIFAQDKFVKENKTKNTSIYFLSPLAEDAHDHEAGDEAEAGDGHGERVGVGQLGRVPVAARHPVAGPHLHDADPDEDAGRDGVEGADGDERRPVVAVELAQDADADGHADGGDEGEDGRQRQLALE